MHISHSDLPGTLGLALSTRVRSPEKKQAPAARALKARLASTRLAWPPHSRRNPLCPCLLTLSFGSCAQVEVTQTTREGTMARYSSSASSANGARFASPPRHAMTSSLPGLSPHLCSSIARLPPHGLLRTVLATGWMDAEEAELSPQLLSELCMMDAASLG